METPRSAARTRSTVTRSSGWESFEIRSDIDNAGNLAKLFHEGLHVDLKFIDLRSLNEHLQAVAAIVVLPPPSLLPPLAVDAPERAVPPETLMRVPG